MKTKQFNKKLVLNKKTIADLSWGDMKSIRGKGIHGGSETVQIACCPQTLTAAGCLQRRTDCCLDPEYTDDDVTCPVQTCNTACHTCQC